MALSRRQNDDGFGACNWFLVLDVEEMHGYYVR